jgi:hypothetical protein
MRHWLIFAVLALSLSGCKSSLHPDKVKQQDDIRSNVPNGETAPFGPPPTAG